MLVDPRQAAQTSPCIGASGRIAPSDPLISQLAINPCCCCKVRLSSMCQFSAMPAVGYSVNIGRDEIDRLAMALDLPEASREMTAEAQVRDDTITGHDHLLNFTAEVGDRRAHQLRSRQRSGRSLGAPRRQRIVGKVRRKRCAR